MDSKNGEKIAKVFNTMFVVLIMQLNIRFSLSMNKNNNIFKLLIQYSEIIFLQLIYKIFVTIICTIICNIF